MEEEILEQLRNFNRYFLGKSELNSENDGKIQNRSTFYFNPKVMICGAFSNLSFSDSYKLNNSKFPKIEIIANFSHKDLLGDLKMKALSDNGEEFNFCFGDRYSSIDKLEKKLDMLRKNITRGYANGILNFWRLKGIK